MWPRPFLRRPKQAAMLGAVSKAFGVSPWEYVMGERPRSLGALAFDLMILNALCSSEAK